MEVGRRQPGTLPQSSQATCVSGWSDGCQFDRLAAISSCTVVWFDKLSAVKMYSLDLICILSHSLEEVAPDTVCFKLLSPLHNMSSARSSTAFQIYTASIDRMAYILIWSFLASSCSLSSLQHWDEQSGLQWKLPVASREKCTPEYWSEQSTKESHPRDEAVAHSVHICYTL